MVPSRGKAPEQSGALLLRMRTRIVRTVTRLPAPPSVPKIHSLVISQNLTPWSPSFGRRQSLAALRSFGQPGANGHFQNQIRGFRDHFADRSLPGVVAARAELENVSVALLRKSMPLPKAVLCLSEIKLGHIGDEVPEKWRRRNATNGMNSAR